MYLISLEIIKKKKKGKEEIVRLKNRLRNQIEKEKKLININKTI